MKGYIEMDIGHTQSPANLPATTGPDLADDWLPPREGVVPPREAPPPRPLPPPPPPPLPRPGGGWPRGGAVRGGIAMV